MRKLPYISHFLTMDALVKGEEVNGKNGYDKFMCSRISNVISDFRKDGVLIDESATEKSAYSHYKPYRLIQTKENIAKAEEVRDKYKSIVEQYEAKGSGKSLKNAS
jgi:ABC-type uncharacterized transport system ATPase subunit